MVRSASTKPSSAVSLLQGLFFFSFYRARSFLFLFLFTGTGLAVATIGAMGSSVVTGMMLSRSLCYLVIIWYDVWQGLLLFFFVILYDAFQVLLSSGNIFHPSIQF